jgi:hypothetical protein
LAAEGINTFLAANPGYEIKPGHVFPVQINFNGGVLGQGVLVVFSAIER